MKIAVLLVLLSVSECCSSREIIGYVGQNVTLVCTYDATTKQLHACWGRGWIPVMGCDQQLISTDGHKINEGTRVSNRYQLLGRLDKGDVSLTILNITKADSGQYGCRVEKPGLFNDEKHHISLVVQEAAHSTTSASTAMAGEMGTESVSVSTRAVQLTSTNTLVTSSLGPLEPEENGVMTAVLVCGLFGLIVLVTAVITRKWGKLHKISQSQQVNTLFQLSSVSSGQLHSHTTMVENTYEIDVGADGGEYEYLP